MMPLTARVTLGNHTAMTLAPKQPPAATLCNANAMAHILPPSIKRYSALALWTLLTLLGSIIVGGALQAAAAQHTQSLQVILELRPSDSMTRDTQANTAMQALTANTSVATAEILTDATLRATLMPWLGTMANDELPNAQLLRVTLKSNGNVPEALENIAKLADDIPGGNLADYYRLYLPQLQQQANRAFYNAMLLAGVWLGGITLFMYYLPPRYLKTSAPVVPLLLYFGAEPKRLQHMLWQQWARDTLLSSSLLLVLFTLWQLYNGQMAYMPLLLLLPMQAIMLWWQSRRTIFVKDLI